MDTQSPTCKNEEDETRDWALEMEALKASHDAHMSALRKGYQAKVDSLEQRNAQLSTDAECAAAKQEQVLTELKRKEALLDDAKVDITDAKEELVALSNRSTADNARLVAFVKGEFEKKEEHLTHIIDVVKGTNAKLREQIVTLKAEIDDQATMSAKVVSQNASDLEKMREKLRQGGPDRLWEVHFIGKNVIKRSYACKPTDTLLDLIAQHEHKTKKSRFALEFSHHGIELKNFGKTLEVLGIKAGDEIRFQRKQ